MTVRSFEINIPQAVLDDLQERLAQTRWPDTVDAAGWEYGTNLAWLQQLIDDWQHRFDWRAQEQMLNRFAHYRADVDGLHIHFIHERGKGENPLPLLLLHGWPSSFVQMLKIIPLLTDPAAHGAAATDSFDVVAASLPGFGFSDRPTAAGMSVACMAGLFERLMSEQLGYERFASRATDLGAGVVEQLALTYPDRLIGVHTGGTNPWIGDVPNDLTPAEQEFVGNVQSWSMREMAYAMLQASKPQTLAYGLNDSPAGLAAWIIEKFRTWTDCDGNLDSVFTRDELLTNLTIYWATETINSSIRLYFESMRDMGTWGRSEVPTAMAMPPNDFFPTPREWVERSSRVDRWTELPRGGHFPEWEVPVPLAADIRAFFRPLRVG